MFFLRKISRLFLLLTLLSCFSSELAQASPLVTPWLKHWDFSSVESLWTTIEMPPLTLPTLNLPTAIPVSSTIELSVSSALTPELKYKLGFGNTWVIAPQLGAIIRL